MDVGDLEELVRTRQAEIYRYLRYLGADQQAAEDLVQETFLVAFKSLSRPGAEESKSQSGWLRGVARNLFLAYCRRRRTSPVQVDSDYLGKAEAVWAGEFLRDGDGFDYLEALRGCLEVLPENSRQMVDLQYAQQKSRAEMAQLHGMTEDGVKSAMRRIRTKLAECVHRRLGLAVS